MNAFFNKTRNHFDQKLPFVIYKKPNENKLIGLFQGNDDLHLINDFSEKGFVFCSFDEKSKNTIIPNIESELLEVDFNFNDEHFVNNFDIKNDEKAENDFIKLVSDAISDIRKNKFLKVVLSRKERLVLKNFDFIATFCRLASEYETAFCYCYFHPKIGFWLGATPEQLLKINENQFTTVSLAGTKKFEGSNEIIWQKKEIEEQKIVTDFISNNLKNLDFKLQISSPKTIQAGNLLHLKSIISGKLNSEFDLYQIIKTLHPTPAVCGLPRAESKKFINENENYNREFYTGFIGELNINDKTDLFVNLRCMKIVDNFAYIYVGCGITKDSIPKDEFIETVNKSLVMRSILDFRNNI